MSGIKSIYVDSSACVRIKGSKSEQFRIDSEVRQGCIMSPWLITVYMDGVMKEGNELSGGWERVEIAWPLVHADDLVLCDKMEDLKVMVGWFTEVYKRR